MRRAIRPIVAAGALLLVAAPGLATDGSRSGAVVVADVRGPLEERALDFLTDAVATADARVVVLQIDNPGIASGDPIPLYEAVAASRVPVVAWVGPSGAEAYGGVARLLVLAGHVGAAPGSRIGYLDQQIAGGPATSSPETEGIPYGGAAVEVTEPIPGLVDEVVPTIGQFIASLDGRAIPTVDGPVEVDTTTTQTADDGSGIVVPSSEVRFLKPDLTTRFLRLAIRPEATFFFLTVGVAAAVFEFYAVGAGITAAIAAIMLFLAGFGISSLPMSWSALGLVMAGMLLYVMDFQDATVSWRGVIGTVALLGGGINLTVAAPQFGPRWWAVVLTVVGVAAFFLVALTTVARSRFSTRTIGRGHLVGRLGVAETSFDPTGIVDLDGARWQARTQRASGLAAGDSVEVIAVNGVVLEVAPVDRVRE